MTAIRLARAYTGRSKIIKFAGCYHGHADMFLVQAGSGVASLGLPDSPGVPASTSAETLVASFNSLSTVSGIFEQHGGDIAAVIVEPITGNMGVIQPQQGFLDGLRDICSVNGALLIFDEIITGFRAALGGAQSCWGIEPDITCLGKVIGGGLPVGAYGGRLDIMEKVAPLGDMYQAGTLSGNPLATSAGLATLQILRGTGIFDQAQQLTTQLAEGIQSAADIAGVRVQTSSIGTMLGFYFLRDDVPPDKSIHDYETARKYADTTRYAKFFHSVLERGIYFAPSQFEAAFVSTAHSGGNIDFTLSVVAEAMQALAD
jgi:glutamate-1-semialdehyde 2,1-aminomutase